MGENNESSFENRHPEIQYSDEELDKAISLVPDALPELIEILESDELFNQINTELLRKITDRDSNIILKVIDPENGQIENQPFFADKGFFALGGELADLLMAAKGDKNDNIASHREKILTKLKAIQENAEKK
ncbi:MAG TPA: hypothetical protein DDX47_02585 [Candidatus Jacksonbacteria bacterium]|nr:hypothetical protein [Candidatus Jacksonbacteria bacterium]HCC49665.1 hypothetical protein [Candidatus Jacksonbacteria bacterium]HCE49319.1 hypothetical protein [Candidatus Jacksonbacteria bacterium]HCR14926.1 hypothetical protein [Candidatus Jacksonbacteria bacterium]